MNDNAPVGDAPPAPESPPTPAVKLAVVDAPVSVLTWLEQVSAELPAALSAQAQNPNHPANPAQHGALSTLVVLTLPQLWRAVEQTFVDDDGEAWSMAKLGLPPVPDPAQGNLPDKGTLLHNLYHALGGTH